MGYLVGVILTVLSIIVIKFASNFILGKEVGVLKFVSYVSPTVVFSSLSLFVFCSRLEFNNLFVKRILSFISSLSFGVYIFHSHDLLYDKILLDYFSFLGASSIIVLIGVVLGATMVICLGCGVIVYLRSLLFKLCKVDKLANNLGDKIDNFVKKEVFGQEKKEIE